jgi:ABC-2 type transport system permease protein
MKRTQRRVASAKRVAVLARRIIKQILRDRRTVGLLIVAPMIMLSLGAVLFRAELAPLGLGVVQEDQGLTAPGLGSLRLGERIVEQLQASEAFQVQELARDEVDASLRDGTVSGVVLFPADFSAGLVRSGQVILDLRLEGSNPNRSMAITARVTEASMKALAGLAAAGVRLPGAPAVGGGGQLPVRVETSYLYGGQEIDTMDFVAPVYIALLAMFFVFLLTCVSFLRERSQGTMERLLATPATRVELVLGYMAGLGLFALVQVAVIVLFTVGVLRIHYLGSLALLFLVVGVLAVVGVSLGILASAFARNEFQVVQFIPLLIIPQGLLGGTFWAVEEMPQYLQPFGYLMPITYANRALRNVMLKGWGLADIWPDVAVLAAYAVVLIVLGSLTMRREVT